MSAFSGKQGRGAKAVLRKVKREEAEERNARTAPEKRKAYRRNPAAKLITDIFTGDES